MYIENAEPSTSTEKPFHFLTVDNNTQVGINNGAELSPPDFTAMFSKDIIMPLIFYVMIWYSINVVVTMKCWTTWQEGIKRKRLINLTTSLIHSSVSGLYLLVFFIRNTRLMFEHPLHYYNYGDSQIVLLSIAYFFYDAFDLMVNDKISIATGVLLFHHSASIFVLSSAIASKKFLLYAYWALLMEMSSIFLHSRSILHTSKLSQTSMITIASIVKYLNLITFIIFRFGNQTFLFGWAWVNWNQMHTFYLWVAFFGGGSFLLINIGLFMRILHSDGFLLGSVVQPDKLDALLDDNDFDTHSVEQKELLL